MLFIYKSSIKSTQIFLYEMIKNLENDNANIANENINILNDIVIALAKNQTDGIGSRGNSWEGVECGLYISFSVHKNVLPLDLKEQSLSIYFGVIFLKILREFNCRIWLKWPNDFYIDDEKIGGIMSNVTKNHVIVGVGINLYAKHKKALFDYEINHTKSHKIKDEKIINEKYCKVVEKILAFFDFNKSENILKKCNFNENKFDRSDFNASKFNEEKIKNNMPNEKCSDIANNNAQMQILHSLDSKILHNYLFSNADSFAHFCVYNNHNFTKLQNNLSWHEIFQFYSVEFYKNKSFSFHVNDDIFTFEDAKLKNDGSIMINDRVFYSLR